MLTDTLHDIAAMVSSHADLGKVADDIPQLSQVDPARFGLAVALPSGEVLTVGDAAVPFSIQSISKVFTLAIALGRAGDALWQHLGREPSGMSFNSILQLEQEGGIARNPFVNAGALVVTDTILAASEPREVLGEVLRFLRGAAEDDDVYINKDVARSEARTGHHNKALAHMLKAQGRLGNLPVRVLGTYFHQCAIEMTCVQLARAGLFLVGGEQASLVSALNVRRINALMTTCGHYDGSGDFAYRVGLPAKSGVGGGILVIAPHRASIAVWSPGLNAQGNSKLGTMAAEMLAERMNWSVFG